MSEQITSPFDSFFEKIREIVREEIKAALNGNGHSTSRREWLKAEELAEEYGLPKTWFEERGRAGDIARTKPGRYVLFKRRDVEAFLEKKKSNSTP
jgi:excisionase family DNA binding protein